MTTEKYVPMTLEGFADSISEKQYARLGALFDGLKEEPFIVSSECPYVLGSGLGLMHTVTMRQLIYPSQDAEHQFGARPERVASILLGNGTKRIPGLLETREIITPIQIGVDARDTNSVVGIVAGQNRLTALLTAYHYSGVNVDSEEFLEMRMPVFVTVYTPNGIVSDNSGRNQTPSEIAVLYAGQAGVDIRDPGSILAGFEQGVIKAPEMMRLLAVNLHEYTSIDSLEDEAIRKGYATAQKLSADAFATAVSACVNKYKRLYSGDEAKRNNKKLANPAVLLHFFHALVVNLPDAYQNALKIATNLSRKNTVLSDAMVMAVRNSGYELPAIAKPVEEPVDDVPAEAAASRKSRKKKAAAAAKESSEEVAPV